MKTADIAGAGVNGLVLLCMPLALNIYSLTPETAELTKILVWIHCAGAIVMWPVAFTLPNALRAANDVRMPMVTSVFTMVVFRILFSVILGIHFQMGVIGVWIAMIMDWIFRLTLFILRYRKGKWKQMNLIEGQETTVWAADLIFIFLPATVFPESMGSTGFLIRTRPL